MIESKFSCFWDGPGFSRNYLTGVSLHGHTNRSREALDFIPQLAQRCPMLHAALEKQCKRSTIPVDFNKAFWTPPLTPMRAYETE
jgi:hypothetical protein